MTTLSYSYICDLSSDRDPIRIDKILGWCNKYSIPYPLNIPVDMHDWCYDNLAGDWYYYFTVDPTFKYVENIVFWFEEESDIVGFKLMWEE